MGNFNVCVTREKESQPTTEKVLEEIISRALCKSAKDGNVEEVREILESSYGGACVNALVDGRTPLLHALSGPDDEEVAILLVNDPRVDVCIEASNGDTALSEAVGYEWNRTVKVLIRDPRVDVNSVIGWASYMLSGISCGELDFWDFGALLQRPEFNPNKKVQGDYDLDTVMFDLYDEFVLDREVDTILTITKLLLSDSRTILAHARKGLESAVVHNYAAVVKVFLQHEKSRIDADRARLAVFSRQSPAGLNVPDEVARVKLFPFLGQMIITQDVFDRIASTSYDDFQWRLYDPTNPRSRPAYQPMIDLLTTFLREYGNIDDFIIPTVWS